MAKAARLRRQYGLDVGTQRAPFFELQTEDFALLAIDTGVLRTVDEKQWSWIERALARSYGKFIMAIVGHPRFARGEDLPPTAEDHDVSESSANFAALYYLLARHNVRIAMAGDTHDFEYYREKIGGDGGAQVMHHFVNGGGGAYLPQYRHGPRLYETACRRRLGVLSEDRPSARQDGPGDAAVETAVLVLGKVVQGLAVPRRGPLRLL